MGLLCLKQYEGEWTRITVRGVTFWVGVYEVLGRRHVRVAYDAPPEVIITRNELLPPEQRRKHVVTGREKPPAPPGAAP